MTKEKAIVAIKDITSGGGIDRDRFPEIMRGKLAQKLWNETEFALGFEYGYILSLMDSFDITEKDL